MKLDRQRLINAARPRFGGLVTGRRSRLATTVDLAEQFRQAELLPMLYSVLEPEAPLPPMRGWAASPDILLELALAVIARRPRVIVEFGSGTSSIVLGLAARKAGVGRVFSFDHEAKWAGQTRDLLPRYGLAELVTVSSCPIGPVRDRSLTVEGGPMSWYTDARLPDGIDLAFIDGPVGASAPLARYPALPAMAHHLSPEAVVFADDTNRPEETEVVRLWLDRYAELSHEAVVAENGAARLLWRGPTPASVGDQAIERA